MGGIGNGVRTVVCAALCAGLWSCRTDGPDDCWRGTAGCACLEGDLPCLAEGLFCNEVNVCVASDCATPGAGCACGSGGRCDAELTCEGGVCARCEDGKRGCACTDERSCAAGLVCLNGLCVREPSEALPQPVDPPCYTPCNQSVVTTEGTTRVCSPEGLLAGCLEGLECVAGTCVATGRGDNGGEGGAPGACSADADCPDFTACLQGACMSNCERDDDCPQGLACSRKVCRFRCTTSDPSSCPAGHSCTSAQGEVGVCLPLVDAPASTSGVSGTFSVRPTRLELSNVTTWQSFVIENDSRQALEFVVHRKAERRPGKDGGAEAVVEGQALSWLPVDRARQCSQASLGEPLRVLVEGNGGTVEIEVCEAGRSGQPSWTGVLEVSSAQLGTRTVDLAYAERPDGQWTGTMVYLGAFETDGLASWVAAGRADGAALQGVRNAFVRRFGELKYGRLSWREFLAVLQATRSESWQWPSVRAICASKAPQGACYLYDVKDRVVTYTSSQATVPVPSGVVEVPFAMNIRAAIATAASGNTPAPEHEGCGAAVTYEGRIETAEALQYAGNPTVTLTFEGDPVRCGAARPDARLLAIVDLEAHAYVGGRFVPAAGAACNAPGASRYDTYREPWLVPGFLEGVEIEAGTSNAYRNSCRDTQVPLVGEPEQNKALALANPVADGLPRARALRLVDGALVNQKTMVILFEEVFASLLRPGEDFSAYGFLVLERNPTTLTTDAYEGMSPERDVALGASARVPEVTCSAEVLEETIGQSTLASAAAAERVVRALLSEPGVNETPAELVTGGVYYVCTYEDSPDHYRSDFANKVLPLPANANDYENYRYCPAGAEVTFFTLPASDSPSSIVDHPCNARGTCLEALAAMAAARPADVQIDPVWRCTSGASQCDRNRWDLRDGKEFYRALSATTWVPLSSRVASAFRYKTRFRNRLGVGVGFTPEICATSAGGGEVPYCYDPPAIEALRARVDCALALYRDHYASMAQSAPVTAARLREFLEQNVSATSEVNAVDGSVLPREGFDYLWAELLIMLGDDAYASSFAARLDLANNTLRTFEGEKLERNGVRLGGGAGLELYVLYQAAQYYQMVLDRFYRVSPALSGASGRPSVVGVESAATYYARLARASSQKAKTWSEVARRYQNLHRADLARAIIERAYTAAYLESVLFSRLMQEVAAGAFAEEQAQLRVLIEQGQASYRAALVGMRETYDELTAELNYFGFAPDYIPFPALDPQDRNAFEKLLPAVQGAVAQAAGSEDRALEGRRDYQASRQSFQNELTNLETRYERELGELCGTFENGGVVHPAIAKYAHLSEETYVLGDPCGLMGTGQIYEARTQVVVGRTNLELLRVKLENLAKQEAIETEKVKTQCGVYQGEIAFEVSQTDTSLRIRNLIAGAETAIAKATQEERNDHAKWSVMAGCSPTVSMGMGGGSVSQNPGQCIAAKLQEGVTKRANAKIAKKRDEIDKQEFLLRALERERMRWRLENNPQCALAQAESNATMQRLALAAAEVQLEALRADYESSLAAARQLSLEQKAVLVQIEQGRAEEMAISLEAARNDPTARIFKNEAVLAADRTFEAALGDLYRLTKIYEYYASQSYAKLGDLFLVRTAGRSEPSLQSYLDELRRAYEAFGEQYGNPALRVAVVSLRDDVLSIPRLDEAGEALAHAERVARFREALGDRRLLDARGYVRLPFALGRAVVSPLTVNHKIRSVEVEIEGSDIGDEVGRVYVESRGTSTIVPVSGSNVYYAFPELRAIVNTAFNGKKVFAAEMYPSDRLRERPLLNTRWDVVLNQFDETVNLDIALGSLSDVRLYFYYTDFTALP